MIRKQIIFILFLMAGCGAMLHAQPSDFCAGLNAMIKSATNSFKDVKDSTIKANESGIVWACKKNIPSSIRSRLISAMGLRYEAAMFQARSVDLIKEPYNKLKADLKTCLEDNGYKLSKQDNFYEGMAEFKKLVYFKAVSSDTTDRSPAPPHISVEVDFLKGNGTYTITLDVWEH